MNDGSGRREGLRAIIEAEASKFGDIKLFAEDALGIFGLKDPVFEV